MKSKLLNREGKWLRVFFADGSYLSGILRHVGSDFIQLECYMQEQQGQKLLCAQNVLAFNLIKFITIDASSFVEEEKRRLEYLASQEQEQHDNTMHELER